MNTKPVCGNCGLEMEQHPRKKYWICVNPKCKGNLNRGRK